MIKEREEIREKEFKDLLKEREREFIDLLVKEDKIFSHPSIKDKHKPPLCHQKNVNEIECIIAEEKIKHNAQKAANFQFKVRIKLL